MKINSIQYDMTLKQGSLRPHSESQNFRDKNSAGVYEKRGYNADYCGSFTGKSKAAATVKKSFLDKILSSNWFGRFSQYSQDHNISTSSLIALVLAGILRPATIIALPGKEDKEDKIYASGHAIASGIIGFVISTIVTSPLDMSIKKFFEDPNTYLTSKNSSKKSGRKGSKPSYERIKAAIAYLDEKVKAAKTANYYEPLRKRLKAQVGAMDTLAKNIPGFFIAIPRAILTIALIPPILKYVFGVEKKKAAPPPKDNIMELQMNWIDKPVFAQFQFKGGVR